MSLLDRRPVEAEAALHDAQRDTTHNETDLRAAIDALAVRVAAIEEHLGLTAAAAPAPQVAPDDAAAQPTAAKPDTPGEFVLPSLGIALLMLAGAFLLRAFTGSGMLADSVGVSLGVAYVAVLLILTDRAAHLGLRIRAHLFGVSAVLVAYPFIWETSTKLGLLAAPGAAAILAVLTGAGLALALRRRLPVLAWVNLVAAVGTCAGLYWRTDAAELFLALMLVLGAATVWLAYLRDWRGPQWFVAGVANFLVFLTVMMAAHPDRHAPGRPEPDPEVALLLAIALPAIYLASFAWRTLVMRREAGVFEILQSLGCIMAGYVGAIHLLLVSDRSTAALGWATMAAGVAGYVVAFLRVRGRQGRGLNFFYFAWLGLLLMLIGSSLVVSPALLPFLWCGLALAAAVAGGVYDRWTLRLHCASYLIGAAVVTGLPAAAFAAFAAPAVPTWSDWTAPGLIVWLAAVVCYGLLAAAQRGHDLSRWRRTPRFLTAALALIGAGMLLVIFLAASLTTMTTGSGTSIVAAIRTAVLAGSSVLLATVGRRRSLAELAWFAGPLLVLAAVKILLDDLRHGTPISLFVSFACFGTALILVPRLRRRPQNPDPDPEGDHGNETS